MQRDCCDVYFYEIIVHLLFIIKIIKDAWYIYLKKIELQMF